MENLGGWDQSEDHPDFDPNLLNVESWGVDHHADDVHVNGNLNVNGVAEQLDTSDSRTRRKNNASSGSWGVSRHVDQWSTLGVTEFDQPDDNTASTSKHDGSNNNNGNNLHLHQSSGLVGIPTEAVEAAVEAAVAAISEISDSAASGDRSGGSAGNNTCNNISQHLHPLGIQSSASCPVPSHASDQGYHQHQQVQQQPQRHLQQQRLRQQHAIQKICGVGQGQLLDSSAPGPSAISTQLTTPVIPNTSSATQHLSSLTANFMLAQVANPTDAAIATAAAAVNAASSIPTTGFPPQNHLQQHTASVISQSNTVRNSSVKKNANSKTGGASSSRRRGGGTRQSKSTKSRKKKTNSSTNAGTDTNALPPFYLFDAPIELRANFMQNQRRLGLPIQHDPNSYHYGETVNGFHPHQYQLPFGANAGNTSAGVAGVGVSPPARPSNAPPPQLIDARHGIHRKNKGGQVKNEREQKRAQKITELIEQLRLQMEEGGWQVEARSKFHTLSNCAQYIKHMIHLTSEKENENQTLNMELDDKRRKIEREDEEKAMQDGRSDPESVTSSLTSDTTMSTARHKQDEETIGESGNDESKKRKLLDNANREGGSSGDDSNNNNNDANNSSSEKKHRISSSEAMTEDSSGDSNRDGSGTGSGSGGSGSGGISKTISSVSELTDSNRGSSSNNSGSGGGTLDDVPTEQDSRESNSGRMEDCTDQPSTSSISSDAAVASEKTSRDRHTGHKDVVFNNDKRMSRKRPPEEVTSLERTFELNYEEVFHKSNIPQLIASTSGKIVTWNECFGKATGYRKSEIERMTIFSLVKAEDLAKFFEIVAAALRPDDEKNTEEKNGDGDKEIINDITNSDLKLRTISESASSQDSLSGYDTVTCSNNENYVGEHGGNEKTGVQKNGFTDGDAVATNKEEQSSSKLEELANNISGKTANQESCSNSTDEGTNNMVDTNNVSANTTNEEAISNSTEDEGTPKNNCGPSNEEVSDKTKTLSKESQNNALSIEKTCGGKGQPTDDTLTENGSDEFVPKRLLNYTAMTLPCIDFPAMTKRNQAAIESGSAVIPPLHVTITLMSDQDPNRRCFHCVFTNSKGTNGALGIVTPELLASLFAKPLRNSRRKKNHYASHGAGAHQHQRKRARLGTTRVGQSVSTSTIKEDEQNHCLENILSTSEEHEKPPSPLLMPPPGPPAEDNLKQEESE